MRSLIICADDANLHPTIDDAIVKGCNDGVLRWVSVLGNMPNLENTAQRLIDCHAYTGLHINLTQGKSLTYNRTLLDEGGIFFSKNDWWDSDVDSKINPTEVYDEISSQVLRVMDSGLNINFLNGHNHVHIFPQVIDQVVRIAKEYDIPYIRAPYDDINYTQKGMTQLEMISIMGYSAKEKFMQEGLLCADHFTGLWRSFDLTADMFIKILKTLPEGITEFMMHPGYKVPGLHPFHSDEQRELELNVVLDPKVKEALAAENIDLIYHL